MTTDFNAPVWRIRPQDLAGKVAVVTGASKGIGRAVAVNFLSRGCAVLVTYSSPESAALVDKLRSEAAQLYREHGAGHTAPKLVGLTADITSDDCSTKIADSLTQEFGGVINILVNNAATTGGRAIGENSLPFVRQKFAGNVHTPIMLVEELVKRRAFRPCSRIVNISSDRARRTSAESLVYSATKAALESLARTWALALGGNDPAYGFMAGTTANSVSVGGTETTAASRLAPEQRETRVAAELRNQVVAPDGQTYFAQAEEVADVVGLLCSSEARWLTGSVVPANGGASMIL